jgi:hypothetical protein
MLAHSPFIMKRVTARMPEQVIARTTAVNSLQSRDPAQPFGGNTTMSHPIFRLFAAGLLTVAFALSASAGGAGAMIKKGSYNGLWHDAKVKFDIEKVSKNGKFSGVIHFDPKGPFPNATAPFTGEIDAKGAIVIHRGDEWKQDSRAGAPKRGDKFWHWKGETTGKGLEKGGYSFELNIPH